MVAHPTPIRSAARRNRCGGVLLTVVLAASIALLAPAAGHAQGRSAAGQAADRRISAEGRLIVWQQHIESPARGGRVANDFLIRRARVVVQARVSEALNVSVQVGQDNVGARFATSDDGFTIKDAYLNYRAGSAFQVAVGQFKVPFLRANLESGFNQVLVDRGTLPTIRPARQGSRDLGVMAWGNARRSQYRIAVFDGSDQDAAEAGWRFTGRIAQNWFSTESGLGYTSTFVGTTRVLQLAAQLDMQGSRLDSRDDAAFRAQPRDYRAWAVEGYWEQPVRSWALTAEAAWFERRDEYENGAAADRHIEGYYAQGAVLLPASVSPGRLQFAVRREDWTAWREASVADIPITRTTVGAGTRARFRRTTP